MSEQIYKTGDLVASPAPNGHYMAVVGSPAYTPRSGHLLVHIVGSSHGSAHSRPVRRQSGDVIPLWATWKGQTGLDFEVRRDGQGVKPAGSIDPKRIRRLKRNAGLLREARDG